MYQLLDSGDRLKLEAFGPYTMIRPCSIALWSKKHKHLWHEDKVDAIFTREENGGWVKNNLPESWEIEVRGVKLKLNGTDFGHVGLFPEHMSQFDFFEKALEGKRGLKVLNLFAYSGLSTVFLAKLGCVVTHVDASKPSNLLAKENAAMNSLDSQSIRWITDDVIKFIEREKRRESLYDAIVLDPPSFGRGNQGQVFKIEENLGRLIQGCKAILTKNPTFFLFTNHTPGFTPLFLERYFCTLFKEPFQTGEMQLGDNDATIPLGSYYRWKR